MIMYNMWQINESESESESEFAKAFKCGTNYISLQ